MKRRTFVKDLGILTAVANLAPACTLQNEAPEHVPFKPIQQLTLKEFEDEHEEYPCLVTNHRGGSWLIFPAKTVVSGKRGVDLSLSKNREKNGSKLIRFLQYQANMNIPQRHVPSAVILWWPGRALRKGNGLLR